jgi:hypothetical protein
MEPISIISILFNLVSMNGVEPISNSKNTNIFFENSLQAKQHIFSQTPIENTFVTSSNSKIIQNLSYLMTNEIKIN